MKVNFDNKKRNVRAVQIPLVLPEFQDEHTIKLYCLNNNKPCLSPYLTAEQAAEYIVNLDKKGNLIDKNHCSLEDGEYLTIITATILDNRLVDVTIYASLKNEDLGQDLYSLPATAPCNESC